MPEARSGAAGRTLIVSDLHLGSHKHADVLRRPELRRRLVEAAAGAERLILLGDILELRSGPLREALEVARPLFEELGEALAGRSVVLVPGNHDYALIAAQLELDEQPLSLERRFDPAVLPGTAALAQMLGETRFEVAYPGLWLREDVYATHGHYLDCHLTVPTFERLAIGAMARFAGAGAEGAREPADYEALVAPIYAWINATAQRGGGAAVSGGGAARAWRALAGDGRRRLRLRALAATVPLAIGGLNRIGLGPLRSDLSGPALRRASLAAMADVARQLQIEARHIIFGHTHRTGPLEDDHEAEWRTGAGAQLHNCGSWVFETHLMTRTVARNPYWPGGAITLTDSGPPRLERLLGDAALAATG